MECEEKFYCFLSRQKLMKKIGSKGAGFSLSAQCNQSIMGKIQPVNFVSYRKLTGYKKHHTADLKPAAT